jgi:phosphopantothenoylcysteine synthetase/decarboxylase
MKILVTGGSTKVMIDQVRTIGNIFRGRTAIKIAEALQMQGHQITVIGTNEMVNLFDEVYQDVYQIDLEFKAYKTYDELYKLIKTEIQTKQYDAVVHSAAVSDYKVSDVLNAAGESIKKGKVSSSMDEIYLKMTPTEKIIDKFHEWGFKGTLIKFKLEVGLTDEELCDKANKSRIDSNADYIVANCLEWARERAYVIDGTGKPKHVKREDLAIEIAEILT